jgi:hypothetical protein
MQSTPEKKRVTWKSTVQEVHFAVLSDTEEDDQQRPGRDVRWDFVKQCEKDIRDESCQADVDFTARPVRDEIETSKDSPSLSSSGCNQAEAEIDNSAAPIKQGGDVCFPMKETDEQRNVLGFSLEQQAQTICPEHSTPKVSASQILSEEDKRAAMKRRYDLLQESQKMPVEEERRLKRERLRSMVPVWSRKRGESATK